MPTTNDGVADKNFSFSVSSRPAHTYRAVVAGIGRSHSPPFLEVASCRGSLLCSLFILADVYKLVPLERGE